MDEALVDARELEKDAFILLMSAGLSVQDGPDETEDLQSVGGHYNLDRTFTHRVAYLSVSGDDRTITVREVPRDEPKLIAWAVGAKNLKTACMSALLFPIPMVLEEGLEQLRYVCTQTVFSRVCEETRERPSDNIPAQIEK